MNTYDPTPTAPVVASFAIEECGTGGTSRGKFTRRRTVARAEVDAEGAAEFFSAMTGEPLSEADLFTGMVSDYETGDYLGTARARTLEALATLALGPHGYGYTWYAVKGHPRSYVPASLAAYAFTAT